MHRSNAASTCRGAAVCLLVVVGGMMAGCGPIQSTVQINKAEVDYERARVNTAYKKAPYEFFSARYYLHKAKEEWGYSEFQAAVDYGEEAERAAESAVRVSEEDPWEDPVDGRQKTYQLRPQETITADPTEIERIETNSDDSSTNGMSDDG